MPSAPGMRAGCLPLAYRVGWTKKSVPNVLSRIHSQNTDGKMIFRQARHPMRAAAQLGGG